MRDERMRMARIMNMSKQFSDTAQDRETMSDSRHIAPSLVGSLVINGPVTLAFLANPEDVMRLVQLMADHRDPHAG